MANHTAEGLTIDLGFTTHAHEPGDERVGITSITIGETEISLQTSDFNTRNGKALLRALLAAGVASLEE